MTVDASIEGRLTDGDLKGLFLDLLGWDQPGVGPFTVVLDDAEFEVAPLAQKRGLHVLQIDSETDVPSADIQHRLDAEVSNRVPERLLVFKSPVRQVWKWPQARPSGGIRLIAHEVRSEEVPPAIVQRLAGVRFSIDEEASISLPLVRDRVRVQFNSDQVTARFYERFQTQHTSLQDGIEGVATDTESRWYASVLMNRLMFIYFLQKKGFLNDDRNYLRSCLDRIRNLRGEDEFYSFYRDVLIPMFHQGFGSVDSEYVDPEVAEILGDVPYVNGGIFEEHEIEALYEVKIPDAEFEGIFNFFDEFRWHLDDRDQGDPSAINPDVVGYIFERYINLTSSGQKEDGAYYTKEDVTGYMASVTLLPRILDRIVEATGVNPFLLLQGTPRRYIHEEMLHGGTPDGWLPPPDEVEALWADPLSWFDLADQPHDPSLQLNDESWVETMDRRDLVDRLLVLIEDGEINETDHLITHNLDIRNLVADLIHDLDAPADVAEVWSQVTETTVIDPTCGSGAFLFAAQDLLDEIYAALLEHARTHLSTGSSEAIEALGSLVATADDHPNDAYFRRKHATLSNLYGVDIMREAIEIAKLRLFLALVAKLDRKEEIEPLPDLDFNLRSGNLLVGFRDEDDARARVGTTSFDALSAIDEFLPKVQEIAEARMTFVEAQGQDDPIATATAKSTLRDLLESAKTDADKTFVIGTGFDPKEQDYEAWVKSHSPFHWMFEFPSIVESGGFDVVIGNPPYIRRTKVPYEIDGYRTQKLPDIYAPCVERALSLLAPAGRFSMILPIAFQFSDRHAEARRVVLERSAVWASTYSRNPAALFTAGLGVRNTIVVASGGSELLCTTCTRRWTNEGRADLFPTTRYAALDDRSRDDAWMVRTGDDEIAALLQVLRDRKQSLAREVVKEAGHPLGFKTTALYYLPVYTKVPPVFDRELRIVPQPMDQIIQFASEQSLLLAFTMLAGEMGLIWWASTGDDFHVTKGTITEFPIGIPMLDQIRGDLLHSAERLEQEAFQDENLLFTPYAGRMTGAWDLRRVRNLTREIDRFLLDGIGLPEYLPALIRAVFRFDKSTGERPGTERGMGWLEELQAEADTDT
ncbi:MAG: Eco57I restriction-modification methylase domain-containing protein [Solirubrobacterales bacterium]|nr:Eco57I restriction-modification methylase domain-containing protein [Solirubrobacterales bacterium]